jgi:putative oxidoreductase
MEHHKKFTAVCTALLILLWSYAALSKLLDYEEFRWQLHNQEIPELLVPVLVWLLPASELITALMLLTDRFRMAGYLISAGLLLVFTLYIGFILMGWAARMPCSCGGVIGKLGWGEHFFFNIFFLALTIAGLAITIRPTGKAENL